MTPVCGLIMAESLSDSHGLQMLHDTARHQHAVMTCLAAWLGSWLLTPDRLLHRQASHQAARQLKQLKQQNHHSALQLHNKAWGPHLPEPQPASPLASLQPLRHLRRAQQELQQQSPSLEQSQWCAPLLQSKAGWVATSLPRAARGRVGAADARVCLDLLDVLSPC